MTDARPRDQIQGWRKHFCHRDVAPPPLSLSLSLSLFLFATPWRHVSADALNDPARRESRPAG